MRAQRLIGILIAILTVTAIVAARYAPGGEDPGRACGYLLEEGQVACYREYFAARLAAYGASDAVAVLKGLASQDPEAARRAGDYARSVGLEAVLLACDGAACRDGVIQAYYEGVGERMATLSRDTARQAAECARAPAPRLVAACRRGAGLR